MNTLPLPTINAVNATYWAGCARGELLIQCCADCGHRFRFTTDWCPRCWSRTLRHEVASGRGVIIACTVVHMPPYAAYFGEVPYVLAFVALEEGPRMMGNIVDCHPADVRVDRAVSVLFERRGEIAIPQFRLAD